MDFKSRWMLKPQFLRQLLHVGPAFAIRFENLKQDLKWISNHWSWLHRAPPSVTFSCAGHKCKKLEQRWIRRQWWKCNKLYLRMFVCIGTAVSSEDLGHKLQNSSSEPRFCLHTHTMNRRRCALRCDQHSFYE